MFKSNNKPWLSTATITRAAKGSTKNMNHGKIDFLIVISAAILFISGTLPAKAAPIPQFTSTFTASSDAQVDEADPNTNYGKSTTLEVDGNPGAHIESYIFFAVTGLRGPVFSAKLRLYSIDNGSRNGPVVYRTGTSWTETNIIWNNRPDPTTPALGNMGSVDAYDWVEYDVSSYVTGSGTYSFVIVADSDDGLVFASRESANPPRLVVTTSFDSTPVATPTQAESEFPILVGAGDISMCNSVNDDLTARLLDDMPGTVFTTGDNVYTSGTDTEFANCYDPAWGRHKSRTKPVPGNHDYNTPGATGYFEYFDNIDPYYAYDLGSWRVYALNSEISVTANSEQIRWLKADLAENPSQCVLAYWHKPRWSSGEHHGSHEEVQVLWEMLYDAGAELVINGHEHNYERFAPMNASGMIISQGLREFVVGTGGAGLYGFSLIHPASQVHDSSAHGVLKLTLKPAGYDWEFVPVAGKTFTDSGSANCH